MRKTKARPVSQLKQRDDIIPNDRIQEEAANEEPRFLNLILNHRDLLEDCMESGTIGALNFFWQQNGRLFAIITFHYRQNDGSLLTMAEVERITTGNPNKARTDLFFQRILDLRVSREDFPALKRRIINRDMQQRFYEIAASHSNAAGESGVKRILDANSDQGKMIEEFRQKLEEVASPGQLDDQFSRVVDVEDTVDDVMTVLQERRDNPEETRGLLTGFRGIDDVLYGLRPGNYAIIVGYPGGGKTTTMFNMAINMAKGGAKVCYVTVESTECEMTERMLAREACVPLQLLRKGGSDDDEINRERWAKVTEASQRIKKIGDRFTFVCVPQKTCIDTVLGHVGFRHRQVGFDVVFLDYLDVIAPEKENRGNPYMDINSVSVTFQSFTKKAGVVGITAQSFNNDAIKAIKKQLEQKGQDGKITAIGLEGIGGSQKLSRDADYVWGLIHLEDIRAIDVYWLKARHAPKAESFRLSANLECCHLVEDGAEGGDWALLADDRTNSEDNVYVRAN